MLQEQFGPLWAFLVCHYSPTALVAASGVGARPFAVATADTPGSYTGSDFTPHDFTMALKLIADGTVRVEPLISHRLPLRELHAGLETVRKQEGLKVVIEIRE